MDRSVLAQTVREQRELFEKAETWVPRRVPPSFLRTKKITAITGVRRCGKSTLLKQLARDFPGYYYLNFEDERLLDFTYRDFNALYEVWLEHYGEQSTFFFDEIQNIAGWEKFVRRLFSEGHKIFVTGSNAKLLSSEFATALTGRHMRLELFPFSFRECLQYHRFPLKTVYTTKERSQLKRHFRTYVAFGGFPEVVKSQDKNELTQLYQDILLKDVLLRFKIRDIKSFRELAFFLLSHSASRISFNNLKRLLAFKSVTTVKNYIEFLEESYLNFTTPKYDFSLKVQFINDRKIFSIDTGLIQAVSFAFSENYGHILENVVFLELKRRGKEVFYHKVARECDFLIREGRTITQAIQVTRGLARLNRERELAGLREAMAAHRLKEGLILTEDQSDELAQRGQRIRIMPVYQWLLED